MRGLEPFDYFIVIFVRNQIREQASVKVVHFMLQAAGKQPVAFKGHGVSVHQGERSLHAGSSQDIRVHFGNAQTAFTVRNLFTKRVQDRIDEVQGHDFFQRGRNAIDF